jgi:hypothetical protein
VRHGNGKKGMEVGRSDVYYNNKDLTWIYGDEK